MHKKLMLYGIRKSSQLYVYDRLIIASLPWTHAEYEQLVGRIYRQKSSFTKVEVIILQVILEHHGQTKNKNF